MLQNPIILFTDVWTENGGSNLAVILGSKQISDVMQQSTDNCFFICAIPFSSCGRLQRMSISVNLVTQFVPLHLFEEFKQRVRNTIKAFIIERCKESIFFSSAVFHFRETDSFHNISRIKLIIL